MDSKPFLLGTGPAQYPPPQFLVFRFAEPPIGLQSADWTVITVDLPNNSLDVTLYHIELDKDAPWFAFLVPTINREAPMKRYHWKGGKELVFPRELTPEANAAIEKVQKALAKRQAHRYKLEQPFKFIVLGRLPHLHGLIFQWIEGQRDLLLIIEWVFLSHQRSKTITKPQELIAQLIWKARMRLYELVDCDFTCIHLPVKLSEDGRNSTERLTKMFEHLLQSNSSRQLSLDSYSGQISVHAPSHKLFNEEFHLIPHEKRSQRPLKALTVFTDASGASHKKNIPSTQPRDEPHPSCLLVNTEQSGSCMWVTLAQTLQQENTCLSMTAAENPMSTCLVGVSLKAGEYSASFDTQMPNELPKSHTIQSYKPHRPQAVMSKNPIEELLPSLPKAAQEPQELELLGCYPAQYCIHLMVLPKPSDTKEFHNI
ncbi:Endogenous retrovirus group K member 11 Pol protein [Turdus rufiventris]|nr:Endogenous retrovirus group K member 11 Pol protein [Turdus rufiventris]